MNWVEKRVKIYLACFSSVGTWSAVLVLFVHYRGYKPLKNAFTGLLRYIAHSLVISCSIFIIYFSSL